LSFYNLYRRVIHISSNGGGHVHKKGGVRAALDS
jgi:hypothetical protein